MRSEGREERLPQEAEAEALSVRLTQEAGLERVYRSAGRGKPQGWWPQRAPLGSETRDLQNLERVAAQLCSSRRAGAVGKDMGSASRPLSEGGSSLTLLSSSSPGETKGAGADAALHTVPGDQASVWCFRCSLSHLLLRQPWQFHVTLFSHLSFRS